MWHGPSTKTQQDGGVTCAIQTLPHCLKLLMALKFIQFKHIKLSLCDATIHCVSGPSIETTTIGRIMWENKPTPVQGLPTRVHWYKDVFSTNKSQCNMLSVHIRSIWPCCRKKSFVQNRHRKIKTNLSLVDPTCYKTVDKLFSYWFGCQSMGRSKMVNGVVRLKCAIWHITTKSVNTQCSIWHIFKQYIRRGQFLTLSHRFHA